MLYCVFSGEEIIGRFKRKEKAIDCMFDFLFEGMKVIMKPMTKNEYREYMEKQISTNLIKDNEKFFE